MPANLAVVDGQSLAVGGTATQPLLDSYLADNSFSVTGILYQAHLSGVADPLVWGPDRTWGAVGLRAQADGNTVIGPAIDMLRRLNDLEPGQWCGMTFGVSSSSLATHWDPVGTFPATESKRLFLQYVDAIKAAEDAQEATFRFSARFQQEADAATSTNANAWRYRMLAYRDALRKHFPDVTIIIARPHIDSTTAFSVNTIRPSVEYLATQPGFAMVDMDPYTMGPDFVHFPASENLLFGRAFADKWHQVKITSNVDALDAAGSTVLQIDDIIHRLFAERPLLHADITNIASDKTVSFRQYQATAPSADTALRSVGGLVAAAIRAGALIPNA